ncbi:BnaA02g11300D [Brassica napus]|uniref:BnaA02g11300D protein n=1 Tax=Brassica napus TaxID=3708 RepID=A0A078FQ17_BRANA|nr:BnaA08g02420D [Brassica napus]CDY56649.1 BnaA02g11300D [Brassica napus]
MAHPHRSDIPG